jgi:hypothetical protein
LKQDSLRVRLTPILIALCGKSITRPVHAGQMAAQTCEPKD